MAGPILKLALFASTALALPFADLQEFSHLHHKSPGSNPPFPQFNPQAGDVGVFPTGSGLPGPTGTAAPVPSGMSKRDSFPHDWHFPTGSVYPFPTGTAAPAPSSGFVKRDNFPHAAHDFPHFHPTGFAPSGFAPGPTGFMHKRMVPTGSGSVPIPTGGFHDFEPPVQHHQAAHQFGGARKEHFKPHYPVFAGDSEAPIEAPTGTAAPAPTAS